MKKILLASALLFSFIGAHSQAFRVGIKGAANSTWLLNKNVFDANDAIDHEASFGANMGASATYMFSDLLGLSLDIMYASVNQHYKGTMTGVDYTLKEKLRYVELPLLLKLTSEKGPYFEIGPKLSLLMKETQEFETEDIPFVGALSESESFKQDYNPLVFSIALGFGVDVKIAEHHYITAGLRLAYNPGTVMKKIAEDEIDEDDHSILARFSQFEEGGTDTDHEYKFAPTHMATGGLVLGYTYEFGGE